MTLNTNHLNVDKIKSWANAHRELALTVCTAKAFAEVEKERVDAYILPLFEGYEFMNDNDLDGSGEKITNPKHLYLSDDDELATKYYADCDRAHRAHGFDGPEGHCPSLVAESLLTEAENLLLAEVTELMGVGEVHNLDLRAKVLDWGLSVCLGTLV